MAVAFTEMTTGETNADANSYTTASVTLTAGRLYIIAIACTKAGGVNPTAVATTGGGATFTSKNASTTGPNYAVWYCVPASTVTDTILITSSTATGCNWHLIEVTGSKVTGSPAGVDAFVTGQVVSQIATATSVTATLTSNITAGNARFTFGLVSVSAAPSVSSGTWSSGTSRVHAGPNSGTNTAWNATPAATDTSATWGGGTSSDRRSYILEIAAQAGEFVGSLPIS